MYFRLSSIAAGALLVLLFTVPASAEVYPEWVNTYPDPAAGGYGNTQDLAVDNDGNVYVTGYAYSAETCNGLVTIKYLADGSVAWTAPYTYPGVVKSTGLAIILDGNGNAYVLGSATNQDGTHSSHLIKYSSDGQILFDQLYDPDNPGNIGYSHFVIDNAGDIIIGGPVDGGASTDYIFTAKYSPDGDRIWMRYFDKSPDIRLIGGEIDIDVSGNIYWCTPAYVVPPDEYSDVFSYVLKYDSDGNLLRETVLQQDDAGVDLGMVRVDNSGNIYALGESNSAETLMDWLIYKLDAAGDVVWTYSLNGTAPWVGEDFDRVKWAAVDDVGNLYVTGELVNENSCYEIVTLKLLPDGTEAWRLHLDNDPLSHDIPRHLCLDNLGHVFVAGWISRPEIYQEDLFVSKLSNDGDILWAQRYKSPASYADEARRIFADDNGNVYAAGFTQSPIDDKRQSYLTIKFAPSDIPLGDVNVDSKVDVGDAVALINLVFRGGDGPNPAEISNANCDSDVNVGDIVYIINFVFKGGPACDCMQ